MSGAVQQSRCEKMVDECLTGDDAKRKGATQVAAANVFRKDCREFSHAALKKFFDDPAKMFGMKHRSVFSMPRDESLSAAGR